MTIDEKCTNVCISVGVVSGGSEISGEYRKIVAVMLSRDIFLCLLSWGIGQLPRDMHFWGKIREYKFDEFDEFP